MSFSVKDTKLYRRDEKFGHKLLSPDERIQLLKPYLPSPPTRSPNRQDGNSRIGKGKSRFGIRQFLRSKLYLLVFTIIHAVFSIYIHIRQAYHGVRYRINSVMRYHHRSPQIIANDVKDLSRLPKHLSAILRLEDDVRGGAELETLVNEAADLAAWCASAGIPTLSIYEKTGILKSYLAETHRAITLKLAAYFGPNHPALTLQAPHTPSIESPVVPGEREPGMTDPGHLRVILISAEDGRDSLVDLTKTLTEMAQRSKISSADVSIDLVDAELSESVMEEPDLLLLFGPHVELSGYPPWQIRLTEIFHVPDNQGVGYQVFLGGLHRYARAQMRLGR